MVVKIQVSQKSSDNVQRVLIYNETREFMYETEEPKEVESVLEIMNGHPKAYFNAEIIDTKFELQSVADWQDW